MEEKESNRWLTTVRDVERQIPDKQAIVIGDRESDMYALFAMDRKSNIQLLVRTKNNRYLWGTKKRLFDKVSSMPLAGRETIHIQKTAKWPAREALIEIRHTR
jgi:histidinol phosphatase-like enzyme